MIWKEKPDPTIVNKINETSMAGYLGIEIIEFGDDFIKAKMPVDHRTKQPMGLLHGGASAALSESLGSIGSYLIAMHENKNIVGIEINANHLKSAKAGFVFGVAKPLKLGKTLHVWNTEISDEEGNLLCTSRLTVMLIS